MSDETMLAREMALRDLDDTQLGAKIGVTADTMRNYRLGRTTPNVEKALRMANALGVTVAHLFPEAK